ncbi:hypothetical protein ACVHNB_31210 [Streptomyces sp. YJ-C3]
MAGAAGLGFALLFLALAMAVQCGCLVLMARRAAGQEDVVASLKPARAA